MTDDKALPLGHPFVAWPGHGERDRCYHKKALVGWDEWSVCAQPRAAHEASEPRPCGHTKNEHFLMSIGKMAGACDWYQGKPEPTEPPDELRERIARFQHMTPGHPDTPTLEAFVRSEIARDENHAACDRELERVKGHTRSLEGEIARATEEAYREAANCIDGAAKELEECAASYEDRALGHPKENMLRQATHWRQAAESIRALQKRSER